MLEPKEIISKITSLQNSGKTGDDLSIEGYVYVLQLNHSDILNFGIQNTRKLLPTHVKAFYSQSEGVYYREIKKNKLLKKKLKHNLNYKPSLNFFLKHRDCLEAYDKDSRESIKAINAHLVSVEELKQEILFPLGDHNVKK